MELQLSVVFFFGCCCCCCCCRHGGCCCCCCCCCREWVFGRGVYSMEVGKPSISFRSLSILPLLSWDWILLPTSRTYVKSMDLGVLICRVMLQSNNSFHGKITKEKYTCSMRIPLTHPNYQNLSLHTTSTPLSYQTEVSPSGPSKVLGRKKLLGFLFAWATTSAYMLKSKNTKTINNNNKHAHPLHPFQLSNIVFLELLRWQTWYKVDHDENLQCQSIYT